MLVRFTLCNEDRTDTSPRRNFACIFTDKRSFHLVIHMATSQNTQKMCETAQHLATANGAKLEYNRKGGTCHESSKVEIQERTRSVSHLELRQGLSAGAVCKGRQHQLLLHLHLLHDCHRRCRKGLSSGMSCSRPGAFPQRLRQRPLGALRLPHCHALSAAHFTLGLQLWNNRVCSNCFWHQWNSYWISRHD